MTVFIAMLIAGVAGTPVFGALSAGEGPVIQGSSSQQADALVERATGSGAAPGVVALVTPADGARTQAGRAAIDVVERTLRSDADLRDVAGPSGPGDRTRIATDGGSAIVTAHVAADADEEVVAERLVARFEDRDDVALGGGAVAGFQIGEQAGEDLSVAETLALPLLILIAFFVFGGARAALVALATIVATLLGAFLGLRIVNELYAVEVYALNLMFALGLGLALDYALFMLARYREETERGADHPTALRVTVTGAGQTVIFSAVTVAVALAALLVFELRFVVSMGIGGVVVSLAAAAAALTVVPAILGVWGPRIVARRGGATAAAAADGAWSRVTAAVMRRPGAVAVVTAAMLLLLAVPALRAQWAGVDASVLPTSQSSRVVHDALERDYPATDGSAAFVALRAPADAAPALQGYANRLAAVDGVESVSVPRELAAGVWQIDLSTSGEAVEPPAQRVLSAVRAVEGPYSSDVGGEAASFADQQASIADTLPLALLILAGGTLIVLWLMTGSVVLPVKTLLMNVLTAAAATGVLVLVFQDGNLEGLLGFTSQGGIETGDYLVLMALVFGLTTDYGVLLLSRVVEGHRNGLSDREAVTAGLQKTGRLLTAAALLLAVAIGSFLTSDLAFLKQIGLGAAVAVLLDAFVVRGLLVPALIALLGDWNWWSPAPLRRLHERIGVREDHGAAAAPSAA